MRQVEMFVQPGDPFYFPLFYKNKLRIILIKQGRAHGIATGVMHFFNPQPPR